MNLLFDIGHPAHIHLFRCFAAEMQQAGHRILFTTRDKDMTLRLLREYQLPYISFGRSKKGLAAKIMGMWSFSRRLWKVARQFKPDILLSHGSIYAAHVSRLINRPHISFEDTGNMEQIFLYRPFTDAILVSDSFGRRFGKKTVVYAGYHELAYLHPNRFRPDAAVLKAYGIDPSETIVLLRFVAWGASHDIQHAGIPPALKLATVKAFAKYGRVIISSESRLPSELQPYQIQINPVDIFHLMAHCKLVFGESGTMASEAAVLGVPAVYIDSTSRDYTLDQEKKYGLVFNYSEHPDDIKKAIDKGEQIISGQVDGFAEGHRRLLADKIDVTAFLKDFVLSFDRKTLSTKTIH